MRNTSSRSTASGRPKARRTRRSPSAAQRTSLRARVISGTYLLFYAAFFVIEQFRNRHAGRMRERKRRNCRRDVRQRRRWSESRGANIDAVVEIKLPHALHEWRNRLQVSLLQRNVGAAQRLGQPGHLEAGVVLRRIELPLRQGLTDRATHRGHAHLCVTRNLLDAVARHEQVEIHLSPLDQCLAAEFSCGALARPFGSQLRVVGHGGSWICYPCSIIHTFCFLAREFAI